MREHVWLNVVILIGLILGSWAAVLLLAWGLLSIARQLYA